MPKYYQHKVCGYYLYYTSFCIIEAMHVHASDGQLSETGSAKFFVKGDGSTVVSRPGTLTPREISRIRAFIQEHYLEMYELWKTDSDTGFYRGH